jgi:leucyl aminopeptidase
MYAALLTENTELKNSLISSSLVTGEKLWHLPFDSEYDSALESDIADMRNVSPERKAGTIVGGQFIKRFAASIPFAHIDIAGTSWFSKERGYIPKYATGFGLRLLVDFIDKTGDNISIDSSPFDDIISDGSRSK